MKTKITRCGWVNLNNPLYLDYHDNEWGKPLKDDILLFEMLTLEGAQAGLSWETILNKRTHYQKVFAGFNPNKVARFTKAKVERLLTDPGIVRNRLKIESTISNAKAFLKIQSEFGSFSDYLWGFVSHKPIVSALKKHTDYPTKTPLSDAISKDLKKRGFRFVGSTIIFAYLQAVGIINCHIKSCAFRHAQEPWTVYIIRCRQGELYTGISKDASKRFNDHQSQGPLCAKFLRGKAPLQLVYQEQADSKSAALKREAAIKKLPKHNKENLVKKHR